jgi:RNA polymerase sigma-70 factor (ECF subfamily)
MSRQPISSAVLVRLHERIVRAEVTAYDEMVAYLFDPLCRGLTRRMPKVDPAIINDAVEDVLLDYLRRPGAYRPGLSRLDTFLSLAAIRDVLNSIRREARRSAAHRAASDEALHCGRGVVSPQIDVLELPKALQITRTWASREQAFLAARIGGEKSTAVLARLLGAESEPALVQRRQVKRMTDRLRVRLRRLATRGALDPRKVR